MKRSVLTGTFVTAVSLLLIGCGQEANQAPQSPESNTALPPTETTQASADTAPPSQSAMEPAAGTTAAPAAEPQRAVLTDDQITAITDATNTAEVDQAKIAQTKAKDAKVKKFAKMMITHHGQAKQEQAKLKIAPKESPRLAELTAQATSQLTVLKSTSAPDFDRTYIDSQVTAHRDVLNLFDTELIPNAANAELKKMLQDFRPKIADHLAEAQQIQTALSATGPTGTTGATTGSSATTGGQSKGTSGQTSGASGTSKSAAGTPSSGTASAPSGAGTTGAKGTSSTPSTGTPSAGSPAAGSKPPAK